MPSVRSIEIHVALYNHLCVQYVDVCVGGGHAVCMGVCVVVLLHHLFKYASVITPLQHTLLTACWVFLLVKCIF